MRRRPTEPVDTNIVAGKKYTGTQLNAIADELLRQDSRKELCRDCGRPGDETGIVDTVPQEAFDEGGNRLSLDFKEIKCENGHAWFQGEGKERGIGGDNPILLEEHLHSRRRREIYTTVGIPDPEIVMGIYNRTHSGGRAVNSPEARKAGASFYK